MIFSKARKILQASGGESSSRRTEVFGKFASILWDKKLEVTPCPWCNATGIEFTLRQLSPEEHAEQEQ